MRLPLNVEEVISSEVDLSELIFFKFPANLNNIINPLEVF